MKLQKGFAVMDPKRLKEIASLGGKTAHKLQKAHKFSKEQAREAGRKGGLASGRTRKKKTGEHEAKLETGSEA